MADGKKVRIGVIGCGRISQRIHLKFLKENPAVSLAAAMDIKKGNVKSACGKFGIPRGFQSPEEMFDKTELDGVLICTPNWVHKDLTLMAAGRGIHVFCEKPMAVNASEGEEMVKTCERAGVNLQIGMCKRFDAGLVKAKKMILSGKLGEVSQITTSFLNPPARLDTPVLEAAKKWGKSLGINVEEKLGLWTMTDPRTGGGSLMEMGTHLLDFILFFTGEEPSDWSGFVNYKRTDMLWEDQGTLLVKFPSGIIATAEMNMSATADNLLGEKGRIYGDRASLAFTLINGFWFPPPLSYFTPTILTRYGPLSPFSGLGAPIPVGAGKKLFMYKLQVDYFVDKILGRDTDYFGLGPDFAATGRDGLHAMRIIDAAYAASGRPSPE
ncbi:MAG: Gfo/Idh/MocA family oxidoreductase [bacterium]